MGSAEIFCIDGILDARAFPVGLSLNRAKVIQVVPGFVVVAFAKK